MFLAVYSCGHRAKDITEIIKGASLICLQLFSSLDNVWFDVRSYEASMYCLFVNLYPIMAGRWPIGSTFLDVFF